MVRRALITLLGALAAMGLAEQTAAPMLQTHGVYQSAPTTMSAGFIVSEFLRFDASGLVLCASSTGTAQEVVQWLRPDNSAVARGQYTVSGRALRFDCTSGYGTVRYEGLIDTDVLSLSWQSAINGSEGHSDYRFVAVSAFPATPHIKSVTRAGGS